MAEKKYWNDNGKFQAEYDTMLEAIRNNEFTFTKASEKEFYAYRRYFNDGDLPGWARSRWDLQDYNKHYPRNTCLTPEGEEELELRVDKALEHEWKRFCKAKKTI